MISIGKITGRTILRIPETADWLSDNSTQWVVPKFRQQEYTLGTYLAYRLEEIGIKNVFSVPGMVSTGKTWNWAILMIRSRRLEYDSSRLSLKELAATTNWVLQ